VTGARVDRRSIDLDFMDRALALAERGRYRVSPNPMVGAVLVRDGRIVGEGSHRRAGGPHAEVVALSRAGSRSRGADLYVTLEPCNHFGRTPPCTETIAAAGVSRVIFALADPNRGVAGGGLRVLARAGISTIPAGASRERAAALQNEKFLTWCERGRPFVLAKWASSLDGRIAASDGRSRWVTGELSRRRALLLREEYDAVLVGAETIRVDDPLLTRRLGMNAGGFHRRIVLDGRLRLPEAARLLRRPEGLVVVTARPPADRRARRLSARGVEVWSLPGDSAGRISIPLLLRRLARSGVTSLMVEGGARTQWSFFSEGAVDRVCAFLAPRVLGGARAPGAVAGEGFPLSGTPRLEDVELEWLGEDLMVTGRVVRRRGGGPGRRR